MSSGKKIVDAKIAEKKIMVFSKTYCPFCKKAKTALSQVIGEDSKFNDLYEVMEIENLSDCDSIQDYLKKITGARSVPRVFINGKCIGGGDETVALQKSGELKKMLEAL